MSDADVENDWNDFWGPLIDHAVYPEEDDPKPGRWMAVDATTGAVTMNAAAFDQIKRELYDWHVAMGEVSKVYSDLTGHRISKPNTAAHHVIGEAESYERERRDDMVLDFLADFDADLGPDITQEAIDVAGDLVDQLLEHFELTRDQLTDYVKQRQRIQALAAKAQDGERCTVVDVALPEPVTE